MTVCAACIDYIPHRWSDVGNGISSISPCVYALSPHNITARTAIEKSMWTPYGGSKFTGTVNPAPG